MGPRRSRRILPAVPMSESQVPPEPVNAPPGRGQKRNAPKQVEPAPTKRARKSAKGTGDTEAEARPVAQSGQPRQKRRHGPATILSDSEREDQGHDSDTTHDDGDRSGAIFFPPSEGELSGPEHLLAEFDGVDSASIKDTLMAEKPVWKSKPIKNVAFQEIIADVRVGQGKADQTRKLARNPTPHPNVVGPQGGGPSSLDASDLALFHQFLKFKKGTKKPLPLKPHDDFFNGFSEHDFASEDDTEEVLAHHAVKTKRARDRLAEKPLWLNVEPKDTRPSPSTSEIKPPPSAIKKIKTELVNNTLDAPREYGEVNSDGEVVDYSSGQWSEASNIDNPSRSRPMLLGNQPKRVSSITSTSILYGVGYMWGVKAFFTPDEEHAHFLPVIQRAARTHHDPEIYARLEQEPEYAREFIKVILVRCRNERSTAVGSMRNRLDVRFNLTSGEAAERVRHMLEHDRYIFEEEGGNVNFNRPYLSHGIRDACTVGARQSRIHLNFPEYCRTSMPDDPNRQQNELPMAFVAFCATIAKFILSEWQTGTQVIASFNADAQIKEYLEHMKTLTFIKDKRPASYHYIMSELYSHVCGGVVSQGQPPSSHSAAIGPAHAALDLANLPE